MAYGSRGYRGRSQRRGGYRSRFSSAKMRAPSRSRYASRQFVRKLYKSNRTMMKRSNLNWSNQFVFGGNGPDSYLNIGGSTGSSPSLVYEQGPDRDHFVARTIVQPPQVDFNRLLFRAYLDGAAEDHTNVSQVIKADTPTARAPLQRFRMKYNYDVVFEVAPYLVSTAAADSGMEVQDFRMESQNVYCFVLLPKQNGNHFDSAPDNKWIAGSTSNYDEALRQGVDWDVKSTEVGRTVYTPSHRAPLINLSRWKVMKRKVLQFRPGVNSLHFRWKWTYKTSDMVSRGFCPCLAHADYWRNMRMPRLFMVADFPIALGEGAYGSTPSKNMTVSFSAMGKAYFGDTPVYQNADTYDQPGDAVIGQPEAQAPSGSFAGE